MNDLEKAKLLSVASKLARAEIVELRSQLIEQINSIQIPEVVNGRDGRSIVDARIFEGDLTLQFNDGSLENLGKIVGETGVTGLKGDKGDKGDPGETGPQGIRGDTGERGFLGKDGERGPRGDKGDRGDVGPKGDKGDQGEQGIPGERGERGERGEQGPSGVDGTNGRDGSDGAKGETGERGLAGVSGREGKDGKDGAVGPKGDKGDKGDQGDKGDPGSDADVTKLEKKLDQLTQDVDRRISKVAFNAVTAGGSSAGSGEVKLYRLDDVDYNTVRLPSDGQALVWSSSLGKWQANTVSGGGGGGGLSNTFTTTVATRALIPTSDDTYSIGSNTARYKDIWLSNSSIYLGSTKLSVSKTNLLINNKPLASNSFVTSAFIGNTTARSLINQKISVANAKSYMQVANAKSHLANTNAYIATKLNTSAFNSYVANNDTYIETKAPWSALTGTNTALRTLISDRLQVANAASIYQTITTERAALANTNAYIANQVSRVTLVNTNLTGTNTALRTLTNARLEVSNSFSSLTVRSANTVAVTTISSNVKLNDALVVNPAGHLQLIINGITYKVPYFL